MASRRKPPAKDLLGKGEQVAMSSILKVEWQPSHYLNASVSRREALGKRAEVSTVIIAAN